MLPTKAEDVGPELDFNAKRSHIWLGYVGVLTASVVAFMAVRAYGSRLQAPAPVARERFGATLPSEHAATLLHLLLALLVIVVVSRGLGALFRRFEQPAVVGEVLAGIALGPSLLGRIAPELSHYVFPTQVAPLLSAIAQVGVILFMFLVGMELDTTVLRSKAHAAFAISHASIVAPFTLGAIASVWLYPVLSTSDVPFPLFALFLGVAMSITAFPVLARILTDRGLHKGQLGIIALSCAAVDDVTAWCLLAFVVSMAAAQLDHALITLSLTVGYVALMWLAVRPLVHGQVRKQEVRKRVGPHAVALTFVALLASALITECIGIHAIFGAFLLGSIIPHESLLARVLKEKLEDVVLVLFLPAFFAFTGLRTQIGLVNGATQWLICAAIIAVACVGKFGGTFVSSRFAGLNARDAATLGVLMNTRGLMELVVLNVGLDLHVIGPTLFAMMVLMAVATTFATSPLVTLLQRPHS